LRANRLPGGADFGHHSILGIRAARGGDRVGEAKVRRRPAGDLGDQVRGGCQGQQTEGGSQSEANCASSKETSSA